MHIQKLGLTGETCGRRNVVCVHARDVAPARHLQPPV
jgi:hypothetical protein